MTSTDNPRRPAPRTRRPIPAVAAIAGLILFVAACTSSATAGAAWTLGPMLSDAPSASAPAAASSQPSAPAAVSTAPPSAAPSVEPSAGASSSAKPSGSAGPSGSPAPSPSAS